VPTFPKFASAGTAHFSRTSENHGTSKMMIQCRYPI